MGRPRGSPNKATSMREKVISAQGATPLSYMLDMLRNDELDAATRFEAAKAAAPYVHPRLSSIQAQHDISERLYDFLLDRKT